MSRRKAYALRSARLTDWVLEVAETVVGEGTAAEKAIDYFVSEVSGGVSIAEFMEREALDWGVFAAWVMGDEKRNAKYVEALKDRGLLRREKLLDDFWRTASIEVPEELATHGDVHKAREALAKAEGLFKQGEGSVKGSVTVTFDDVDGRA